MKKETKVALGIFLLGLVIAFTGLYLRNISPADKMLSPFGRAFDLFSYFKKQERPKYIVYGYLPYWSLDEVEYLQYDRLTHIAYFGLYIDETGNFQKTTKDEDGYEITEPGYNKWKNDDKVNEFIEKAKKSGVRVALTVISHDDESTDKFLECTSCWKTLLDNLKIELNSKNITDVNLNFEYAEYTDQDRAKKFAELTKYINDELDKTFFDSYLVVSAFADSAVKDRVSSDLENLGRNADGIFIMAYDFHRPASDNAGPVSPIDKTDTNSDYDLKTMLKDFLTRIAPNKLILGVPYYGYNWVVESQDKGAKRLEGSDAIGFSESQTYTNVLDTINKVKPDIMWDDNAKEPYFTYLSPENGSIRQVFYENEISLREKYKLAKESNLAGIGIWALGYDGDKTELWNLLYDEFVK